jgi:hypothetical protein
MHTLAGVRRLWRACRRNGQVQVTSSIILLLAIFAGSRGRLACPSDSDAPAGSTYRVLVDLSKKDTFVSIPGSAEATRLLYVKADRLPSPYRLVPAEGIVRFGQWVDIVLEKSPDVRIRLSIVTRGQELAARISPLIGVERGDPVEFTHDRIKRTLWSLQRRVKDLEGQMSAARQAYQRIDTWLATPGNKPLELHKAARLRQKILEQQLVACQQELPAVERRYAAIRAIIELAGKIHATTEIRFTVSMRSGERKS